MLGVLGTLLGALGALLGELGAREERRTLTQVRLALREQHELGGAHCSRKISWISQRKASPSICRPEKR